ncbi:NADP-dependent oxidoreductase [Puia sp.]|jgi:NADPH:quinone reductase-like Zn-dependent oxidoreductase|uniref:NADP-dependent oxidoreductase n=1 Tax=Puia sp. TaxID=2045100 RepID=UPI002F4088BA
MEKAKTSRAVKFDHFGGTDVLNVVEIPRPVPGKGQVLVRLKAAGINPGEGAIREGKLAKMWPTTFPSGEGSDLAGTVEETGEGVRQVAVGDEIIGFTDGRASHADYVLVEEGHLTPRPAKVPWEQAGGLFVVGTTAYAAVKAVGLRRGDVVVISGAAGGVGSVAVQLARNAGATVIGLASEAHHQWLKDHGAIALSYGEGMMERIKKAAAAKINAFIDTHGDGYVDLAIELGVPSERIDTIIDFEAAKKYRVKTDGNQTGAKAEVLAELAELIAAGKLEIPIARVYKLTEVREAYRELEKRHTQGKIVLVP